MKTTMKIFAALTIMLAFSVSGVSQVLNDNAIANANATVIGLLKVDKLFDLEFGNVAVAGTKIIALDGTVTGTGIIPGGSPRQGLFEITKGLNTSVSLVLTGTSTGSKLLNGVNELPISYVAKSTISSTDGTAGTTVPIDGTPVTVASTQDVFYVHLGGQVTAGAAGAQAPGLYTAEVTLTATYN